MVDDARPLVRLEIGDDGVGWIRLNRPGATKRLVWNGLGASVEERLGEEARVVSGLSGTADSREGLAAVIERRTPRFTGS